MSLSLSDAIELLSKIKIVDNLFLKIGILLGLTFFLLYVESINNIIGICSTYIIINNF